MRRSGGSRRIAPRAAGGALACKLCTLCESRDFHLAGLLRATDDEPARAGGRRCGSRRVSRRGLSEQTHNMARIWILALSCATASLLQPNSIGHKMSRRQALAAGLAASSTTLPANAAVLEPNGAYANGVTKPQESRDFLEVILPPVTNRATMRTAIGPNNGDGMWGLEQLLLFSNVSATIRMTVIRLKDGTLWVNSPVAPTRECLALLKEIGGEVSHIVLPVTALEHKAFFGPFVRQFPNAKTWVAPGQYGPFGELKPASRDGSGKDGYAISMPYRVDGVLGDPSNPPPWADELPLKLFYVDLPGNAGPVSEAAFFHRATKTLVCTDAVVFVPPTPNPLFDTIFSAKAVSDPDFWPKSVLQAVFLPLRQVGDGTWPGYERVQGKLLRAPILRAFGDVRAPGMFRCIEPRCLPEADAEFADSPGFDSRLEQTRPGRGWTTSPTASGHLIASSLPISGRPLVRRRPRNSRQRLANCMATAWCWILRIGPRWMA